MKPVADEKPAAFEDVLAAEYRALRPDAGFESGDEKDLIARMHRDPAPLAALCISGGGIRQRHLRAGDHPGAGRARPAATVRLPVNGVRRRLHRRLADGLGAPCGRHRRRCTAPLPGCAAGAGGWPRPGALPARVQQLHVAAHGAVLERCLDHRRHLRAQHPPQLDGADSAPDGGADGAASLPGDAVVPRAPLPPDPRRQRPAELGEPAARRRQPVDLGLAGAAGHQRRPAGHRAVLHAAQSAQRRRP